MLTYLASLALEGGSILRKGSLNSFRRRVKNMPKNLPLIGSYWLHKDRVYKVKRASMGTDEVVIEDISNSKLYEVRFALFNTAYEQVWKVSRVAKALGRHPRTIYRYEERGQIERPFIYPDVVGRQVRFYKQNDIEDIRNAISEIHIGRPRKDKKVTNNKTMDIGNFKIRLKEFFDG